MKTLSNGAMNGNTFFTSHWKGSVATVTKKSLCYLGDLPNDNLILKACVGRLCEGILLEGVMIIDWDYLAIELRSSPSVVLGEGTAVKVLFHLGLQLCPWFLGRDALTTRPSMPSTMQKRRIPKHTIWEIKFRAWNPSFWMMKSCINNGVHLFSCFKYQKFVIDV
jgi:hypothetical protein